MIRNTREEFWPNTDVYSLKTSAIIECFSSDGLSMYKMCYRDSSYYKCSARDVGDVVMIITTDKYVSPEIFRPVFGANATVTVNRQHIYNRMLSLFVCESFDDGICANLLVAAKEAAHKSNGAKITRDGEFHTVFFYYSSEMMISRDLFSRFTNVRVMDQGSYLMESPIGVDSRFFSLRHSSRSLMEDVSGNKFWNTRMPRVFEFSWRAGLEKGEPYERSIGFVKIIHRCLISALGELVMQDVSRAISILPMMRKVKLSQVVLGGLDNSGMGMLGDFRKSDTSIFGFKPSLRSRYFLEELYNHSSIGWQSDPLIYISKSPSLDWANLHVSIRTSQSKRYESFSKIFLKHLTKQGVAPDGLVRGLPRTYSDNPIICQATPARLNYDFLKRESLPRVKVHNCRSAYSGGLNYISSEYISLTHYRNIVMYKLDLLVERWLNSPVAIR